MVAVRIPGTDQIDVPAPARDPGVRADPSDFGAQIGEGMQHLGSAAVSLGAHLYQKRQSAQDEVYSSTYDVQANPALTQTVIDTKKQFPDGGPGFMEALQKNLDDTHAKVTQDLANRGLQPSESSAAAVAKRFNALKADYLVKGVVVANNEKVAGLQTQLNDNVDAVKSSVLSGSMSLDDALKAVETQTASGRGLYGASQLVEQKDKWQQGVIDAAIESKTKAGDLAGAKAIKDKYYGATPKWGDSQAGGVARVAQNLGIAPRDLAAVISYETGGRFDPTMMGGKNNNYQGLIQFGPEERAKYGVKPAQSFNEQLPAVEAFLRDRGIKPGMNLAQIYSVVNAGSLDNDGQPRWAASDGNGNVASHVQKIQRDHYANADRFLTGAGDKLVKVASADGAGIPGKPNADASGDASVASSGDAAPVLPNTTKSLYWDEQFHAAGTDIERQDKIQKIQAQKTSDSAETQYLQDLYTDQPKTTVRQIVNDTNLTREAKERMIGVATRALKDDPLSQTSQETTIRLIDRMRRPDGDPQKITDNNPIFQAYTDGKLSRTDFDWLQKQFADSRTPDGEALGKRKAQFIKGVTGAITKSNPLMGKMDQSGDQQLYSLEFDIDQKIADARKNGKNPHDLLDPSKPEFLGKPEALLPYQKSFQESLADRTRQLTATRPTSTSVPATAPGSPVPSIKPETPPMEGARQAKDGNWYILKDGKYFKVSNDAT